MQHKNTETHGREVSECQFAGGPSKFPPLLPLFFFPRAAELRFPIIERRYGGDMSLRLGSWAKRQPPTLLMQSHHGFEPFSKHICAMILFFFQ